MHLRSSLHRAGHLALAPLLILSLHAARADDATWNLNPTNNDWNTAANWTPATVPNGPSDTATFGSSSVTDVSLSAAVEVEGIVFTPGADAFTITSNPDVALTISGAGVANSSGVLQNFVNLAHNSGAKLRFTRGATAGDSVVYTNPRPLIFGSLIRFEDNSTAGSAEFLNFTPPYGGVGGRIEFYGESTAGDGTFRNTGGAQGGYPPEINFHNRARAGQAVLITEGGFFGGTINFYDITTADDATFTNTDGIWFWDNSTAGSAMITNEGGSYSNDGGATTFHNDSTAGDGTFIANGAHTDYFGNGGVFFYDTAKAADGTFIANGGEVLGASGGEIVMENHSTAENGTFYANGTMVSGAFGGRVIFTLSAPTAATATLIATGGVESEGAGGGIVFEDSSVGEQARVELFGNGFLDLRAHDTGKLTIGSLEGDGLVLLGNDQLTVGTNNLSTTFSGVIQEQGSLRKVGTGALTLSGNNTYESGTTISEGVLKVNNESGSGTGAGPVSVLAGTLGGKGLIAGAVTIGTGSGAEAFLAPSVGAPHPLTLTIQSALTFKANSTYSYQLNTRRAGADEVVTNGVMIESGAEFDLRVVGNRKLTTGQVFTAINNAAATPIAGTFANLPDDSTLTVGNNTFQVDYQGGDGNDLTLTVLP
jgi:autotransporter-associated beta strand protein